MIVVGNICYAQEQRQMEFDNDFRETKATLGNLTSIFADDSWKTDANGRAAAIIRIRVTHMSVAEMRKLSPKGSPQLAMGNRNFDEENHNWYIAVSTSKGNWLEMAHPAYGVSTRLYFSDELNPNSIYDVTLINNETTTISVRSIPQGATVFIDGDRKGVTPCEVPGQRFGKHSLKLLLDGASIIKDIEVEQGHATFDDFDFRKRAIVRLISDPSGAKIYMDDVEIGKAPINEYSVVLGAHTFKAVLNAEQIDEISLNVTENTTLIDLHPVKKGTVQISTRYSGRPVEADLYIDDNEHFSGQAVYNITKPYGEYNFRVSYGARVKEKRIKVNKPEINHIFKLSAKNDFVWPWQREHDRAVAGLSLGCVAKELVAVGESDKLSGEPAYWREGKWLKGFQAGFYFMPSLSWGGGLYFGLFYELYIAKSDIYAGTSIDSDFNHFTEHSLNIPFHLCYTLPFSRKFSISLHSGVGMDVGIHASYAGGALGIGNADDAEPITDYYGKSNSGPGRLNFTIDFGLQLNMGPVGLNVFYSKGIKNHGNIVGWEEDVKTKINKFGFSLSYVIQRSKL